MTDFGIQTSLHVIGTTPNGIELHEAQRSIQTDICPRSKWSGSQSAAEYPDGQPLHLNLR